MRSGAFKQIRLPAVVLPMFEALTRSGRPASAAVNCFHRHLGSDYYSLVSSAEGHKHGMVLRVPREILEPL